MVKNKIVIVFGKYTPPYFTGGIQTYIYFFSKFLNQKGINHEIISVYDGLEYDNPGNITKLKIASIPILGPILFQLKLNRILPKGTIVNVHYPSIGAFLRKDLNVIQTVHTLSSDEGLFVKNSRNKLYSYFRKFIRSTYNKWLEHKSFKKALNVITLNEDLEKKILAFGIPKSKVTIIPNGVDVGSFNFKEIRNISKDEAIKLVYIGRLTSRKNIVTLIESMLYFSRNEFLLEIVGAGEQEYILKELVKKYKLSNIVSFQGFKSGQDLLECFYNSDVYILPSFYEGLPFTVLEAMATGRPCVIGNFIGSERLVKDDYNGFVIPEDNIDSFVSTLKKLVNAKDKLKKYGKNSNFRINEQFDINKSFQRALEVLQYSVCNRVEFYECD